MKKLLLLWISVAFLFSGGCLPKAKVSPQGEEGDFRNLLTEEEVKGGILTPEILWKFGRIGECDLSPDGKMILYTLTRYDASKNKKHTWIYSVPSGGGQPMNLTEDMASCSNPRWVGNDKIAFLCPKEGRNQIWLMRANGTSRKCISKIPGDIGGFAIAPAGDRLWYIQDVKMDSSVQDSYPDLPLAKGMVFDDLMYRHWDAWHDYAYSHIFVTNFSPRAILPGIDIMAGEKYDSPLPPYFDLADIAWAPDGSVLAYSCKKLRGTDFAVSTNSDLYLYHVERKETENITRGMEGYDRYPQFSPDGTQLAFMSMQTAGYEADQERLFVYNLPTRQMRYITRGFDQDAQGYQWHQNSKTLYFISGTKATYQIYEANTEKDSIRQITRGQHDYQQIVFSGDCLIGIRSSISVAPEIFRVDTKTGRELQVTHTNQNIYNTIKMGRMEERWIATTDGLEMLVRVVYPPHFDRNRKYPALLYCQGGPQSPVSQRFSYRWNLQLMAANDYIVVAPNRRGLPTFGKKWNEQISGDYGGQNIRDYLSAIDALSMEPFVDKNHLGAVGASYGGYSVMYLAGVHQKRFQAFIAHCGMFNLESQSAATEEMFFVNHDLNGYYWQKPASESFTSFSPHLHVDQWDTPIMLITGANDFRIPYTESLQAFNTARLRGIPSRLLFFPDEGHWVLKPQNSILWQREFFKWLDQWLKPQTGK